MSIESVRLSSYLIFCCPLLLPSIFPSIRVFSKESAFHIRWPKYWSFCFSLSPSDEYSGLKSWMLYTEKLKVTMKYNLYCSLYSFSKYIKSLPNVPGTGSTLNIAPERKPRGPRMRHEIQVWEISEIWNPSQLNDFLNLAQIQTNLKIEVKHSKMLIPEAKTWKQALPFAGLILKKSILHTPTCGRCTVTFSCPTGFRLVKPPVKMQPKIQNSQKFSQNVS